MFSLLRNRFGIPGVISVVALVFAMIGGAFAASDGGSGDSKASASAVKKGPKGPRGPRGPRGPAGPAGPAGPQGPAGANGANGANGAKGATGATGPTGATGATGPTGAKGATGAEGEEGSPWTAGGTLPSGATITGTWSAGMSPSPTEEGFGVELVSLPIPIPLAAGIAETNDKFMMPEDETAPAGCTGGTVKKPLADPGFICVYVNQIQGEGLIVPDLFTPEGEEGLSVNPAALPSGSLMQFVYLAPNVAANGTYAVTAP